MYKSGILANTLLAVLLLAMLPGCAGVDKVTSSTIQPLQTPSVGFSNESLLDVAILPLNDGLELTDEDDTVFPEVRYAESIYFSNQLAKTMEKSGGWGAVRVTPLADVAMDVYVTGTIMQSDGETLDLKVEVFDTSGKRWFDKRYKRVTGKYAYDRRLKNMTDPFQNLFTEIANDLLKHRETLTEKEAKDLRTITQLRFAKDFSPEAFDEYISEDRKGILSIERLPAENDSILQRVQKIRDRDDLYIDTMQDYYDGFSQQMHISYQDFRRASYDSVVKARQLNAEGNRRIVAGIVSIIGGIYGRYDSNTSIGRDASTATAAMGGYIIKSGLEKKQQAAAENENIAELGASLQAEIAPQVIELEDRTVTLTGTVNAQYEQWRELLRKIYQQERGAI